MSKFNPEKDNPCWGCEYRKTGEEDYMNVCLSGEKLECVREQAHSKPKTRGE